MAAQMAVLERFPPDEHRWLTRRPPRWQRITRDEVVRAGRDSPVEIATDPVDRKVSGRAAEIVHDGGRWWITATNARGVDLHCWGLVPRPLGVRQPEPVVWPRVALYVRGDELAYQHWILLEDVDLPTTFTGTRTTTDTEPGDPPRPLKATEAAAVRGVFADFLAWPPRRPARPRTRKEVAQQQGTTEAAIRNRLDGARHEAGRLGPAGNGLDDPVYVQTLVQHDLLTFSMSDVDLS